MLFSRRRFKQRGAAVCPDLGGRLMDDLDRRIINSLQGGFPVSERPFLDAAQTLGIGERDLIDRLEPPAGGGRTVPLRADVPCRTA